MKSPTRIKSISIAPLRAKLIMPFRIATGQHDSLDNVLIKIHLANGIVGYGEAAVATHITGETVPQTITTLQAIKSTLIGQDITDYLSLCSQSHELTQTNKAALAAIETALCDAYHRLMMQPLWGMWAKRVKPFKTDVTIVIGTLEETKAATLMFYRQGFRHFKIKVGRDMDLDINRICAVNAIAKKSTLLLDANQGYSATQTLVLLKALDKLKIKIALVEQPVPKTDWDGLKKVTRGTKVLVCADESVSSIADAKRAIKEKAVGAINIKLMKTGLIHAAYIMQLAKANNVKLMMGGMMESNIAMTASAHLVAGLGGVDFVDLDTPFFVKDAVNQNTYLSSKGVWDLRQSTHGLGLNL